MLTYLVWNFENPPQKSVILLKQGSINPKMTHILELADKDFKVAIITMLSQESKVSGHFYSLFLEMV